MKAIVRITIRGKLYEIKEFAKVTRILPRYLTARITDMVIEQDKLVICVDYTDESEVNVFCIAGRLHL